MRVRLQECTCSLILFFLVHNRVERTSALPVPFNKAFIQHLFQQLPGPAVLYCEQFFNLSGFYRTILKQVIQHNFFLFATIRRNPPVFRRYSAGLSFANRP